MSITLEVSKVTMADGLKTEVKTHQAVEKLIGSTVQSCSNYSDDIIPCNYNALLEAANLAYSDHRPLAFSPDHIWLMIAQGIAQHINNNSADLRRHFVAHEGKVLIKVRQDDFVWGSPENPWDETFETFSKTIRTFVGEEMHDTMLCNFTTTGRVEKAASEVTLMESMKSYFDYRVTTKCGIPSVELEGETEDWQKILEKIQKCKQFLPDWWTDTLERVCGQFVKTSEGDVNEKFWESMYKKSGGSGGPFISGWLVYMLPYLKNYGSGLYTKPNQRPKGDITWGGPTSDEIPSSVCKTEFVWDYNGSLRPMEFIAGNVGITQDKENLTLRPYVGWAVREADKEST